MSPKVAICMGLALTMSWGMAGCRRAETETLLAARQQILLLGNGAESKTIDPGTAEAETETVIDSALFEGLVNIANDGETILPGVAERWEISPDGKTYTFHLRANARWSDGSPLTADDFVYSFRRVFTPSLGSPNSVYGYAIRGAQAMNEGTGADLGVRAVDGRTLIVQLEYRCPYLLYLLSEVPFQPVPRAAVERFGAMAQPGTAWTLPGNLVSNGPFKLVSWRPHEALVAVRNPYYWDAARVKLREIHFVPTDDLDAEDRAFRSGQLHVTFQLPPSKLLAYRRSAMPALRITPQLDTCFVVMNTTVAPLTDPRVRRALALAIDRDRLVPVVGQGGFDPAHSLSRPGTGGYTPPPVKDFDPARARQLLAEAGFPDGRGFPAVSLRTTGGLRLSLVEALQETWRNVLGIRIEIVQEEQKTFLDALHRKDYQLGLMMFFYGINAPETILVVGQSGSAWNWSGWKSLAFDQAYQDATLANDTAGRFRACDRMERLIFAEAPMVPVAFLNQPHLVSPMVTGWRENALYAIDWRELSLDAGAR